MSTATTPLPVPQSGNDYGVRRVRDELHRTLRAYIEAQYHIRDEGLIRERRLLLEEQGSIAQRPFVEATPVYEPGRSYAHLAIPDRARELLVCLAQLRNPTVGIFDPPYVHQTRAGSLPGPGRRPDRDHGHRLRQDGKFPDAHPG